MIETDRLRIVPATAAILDAELEGRLADALGARVPEDWPPEHYDRDAVQYMRDSIADAGGWSTHHVLLGDDLVGACGYTGPPQDGTVEIGYAVVGAQHRRGIASEAARALVADAFARGATAVIAHTLPPPEGDASIGVLRKLGFEPADSREDGAVGWRITSTP